MTSQSHTFRAAFCQDPDARRRPGLLAWLGAALDRRSQRKRLELLDDRLLRDIGLTRAEALREANRRWWDV